jgi:biotin synthase-related radical SAM superfamily protein
MDNIAYRAKTAGRKGVIASYDRFGEYIYSFRKNYIFHYLCKNGYVIRCADEYELTEKGKLIEAMVKL